VVAGFGTTLRRNARLVGNAQTQVNRGYEPQNGSHHVGLSGGLDLLTLARLMGHSSPSVAARYYVHVTETHVAAGFGKFVEYHTRNIAEGLAAAFPQVSGAVQ
jgi:hypothetical protein